MARRELWQAVERELHGAGDVEDRRTGLAQQSQGRAAEVSRRDIGGPRGADQGWAGLGLCEILGRSAELARGPGVGTYRAAGCCP